ncbi:hypothetical protein N665_0015s0084 [Sinapis alba]|nr:hypothetical protein N665_0015s0084 [Sinapis alba]
MQDTHTVGFGIGSQEKQRRQQKSKEKWATKGDSNTKFYHESVKSNRAKKRIIKLIDSSGSEQFGEQEKGEVATDYFQTLFTSTNPDNFSEFFHGFIPRVTQEMNMVLKTPVSKEEVRTAVFAIKGSSAPGADGMTGYSFKDIGD